jgi:replicative DNA helicase
MGNGAGAKKDVVEVPIRGGRPLLNRRELFGAAGWTGLVLGAPGFLRAVAGEPVARPAAPRRGMTAGIRDLDVLLDGLRPGEFTVLAGPSGVGKTCLAAQFAVHAALGGAPAAFLSLEDFGDDLLRFMACQLACVDHVRERIGPLSEDETARLAAARESLREAPLSVDAWFSLDPGDVRRLARRRVVEDGARLLVVDHHPGLAAPGGRGGPSRPGGREFGGLLRGLARELDVPVLAVTQAAVPEGFRSGDAVESEADRVMLMRRADEPAFDGGFEAREILVSGSRGPAGTARLCFRPRVGRFWSPALYHALREAGFGDAEDPEGGSMPG